VKRTPELRGAPQILFKFLEEAKSAEGGQVHPRRTSIDETRLEGLDYYNYPVLAYRWRLSHRQRLAFPPSLPPSPKGYGGQVSYGGQVLERYYDAQKDT
jgi:hypothetical protein